MATTKKALNLVQKLIEVRKAVPYLKKDNSGYQFKFVSSSQTLAALKSSMDAQGVLLVPSVESYEIRDHTTKKGNHEYFTHLNMIFTWINADDPADTITSNWCGQGLDDAEKGVGKALTYAEKYFMLKFFNIPTDKDDPDSFQRKTERQQPAPPINVDDLLSAIAGAMDINTLGLIWKKDIVPIFNRVAPPQQRQLTEAKDNRKHEIVEAA